MTHTFQPNVVEVFVENARYSAAMAALFLLVVSNPTFAQNDNVFHDENHAPYFQGCAHLKNRSAAKQTCSNEAVIVYLTKKIHETVWPKTCTGHNYIAFEVSESGLVVHPQLLIPTSDSCALIFKQMMTQMPRWEPAIRNGVPVAHHFKLPVEIRRIFKDDNSARILWGSSEREDVTQSDLLEKITSPIRVISESGHFLDVSDLRFAFQNGKRIKTATSRGHLDRKVIRLIKGIKRHGIFVVQADVQKKGQFITVEKRFNVSVVNK